MDLSVFLCAILPNTIFQRNDIISFLVYFFSMFTLCVTDWSFIQFTSLLTVRHTNWPEVWKAVNLINWWNNIRTKKKLKKNPNRYQINCYLLFSFYFVLLSYLFEKLLGPYLQTIRNYSTSSTISNSVKYFYTLTGNFLLPLSFMFVLWNIS